MSKALSQLLTDLESDDLKVAKSACSDAALLLERHVSNRYGDEIYLELFRQSDLLGLRFDSRSYDEVISRLAGVLDRRTGCADVAAWAAGKARDPRLQSRLLNILRDYAAIDDDNLIYQTIIALENYGLDTEVFELLRGVSMNKALVTSAARALEILSMPSEMLRLKMRIPSDASR